MAISAFILAFLFWPVGILLGHLSRSKIRRTGERGDGLALAALIISYIWGAIVVAVIVVAVATGSHSHAGSYPANVEANYLNACEGKGGSESAWGCTYQWFEGHVSYTQFLADEDQVRAGTIPNDLRQGRRIVRVSLLLGRPAADANSLPSSHHA